MIRFKAICWSVLLAVTSSAACAQAPTQNAVSVPSQNLFNPNTPAPDINTVPILANVVKNGAKLFYMGERSGIFGWFIMKDGQVQMIYLSADKKTAIVGGMFTSDGDNVTGEQIVTLAGTNKEVADVINGSTKQQDEISKAGSAPGGFAAIQGNANQASGTLAGGKIPVVSVSPGDRLMQDLQAAAGITLGKHPTAEIVMVMDPGCPHCKATWRELRDSVKSNRLQVRLVPIANNPNKAEDVKVSALLLQANQIDIWEKYVNGDKSVLTGEADHAFVQAVLHNNALTEKWNIQSTPYLVYRAKDGRVKIVQGEPKRMAAVLTDLPM